MAGVDLRTVQELLGHKTVAMTLRYSHPSPAHQLAAVQRLDPKPTGTATGTGEKAAANAEPERQKPLVSQGLLSGPRVTRTLDPLIKSQLL